MNRNKHYVTLHYTPHELPNSQYYHQLLQELGAPHVASFDYMLAEGLAAAVDDLVPVEFLVNGDRLRLEMGHATIECPQVPTGTILVKERRIFPSECRQRAATYRGRLTVEVRWFVNGVEKQSFAKDLGEIPIMVKVS